MKPEKNSGRAKLPFSRQPISQQSNNWWREQSKGCSVQDTIQGTGTTGRAMAQRYFLSLCFFTVLILASRNCATQESEPDIHVIVNMVQLNIAVTDNKGNYVTSLRPQDFAVTEDGISQKIATFGEGNEPTRRVAEVNPNGGLLAAPTDATRALSQDGPATGPLSTLSSLVA